MNKIKPLPTTLKRLKNLFEAFVIFSQRTGVKAEITIGPTEVEEKEEAKHDR